MLVPAVVLSVVMFVLFPSSPLLAWLLAVNVDTLLAYGCDKGIAGGNRTRVPEAVLLGLALSGTSDLFDFLDPVEPLRRSAQCQLYGEAKGSASVPHRIRSQSNRSCAMLEPAPYKHLQCMYSYGRSGTLS